MTRSNEQTNSVLSTSHRALYFGLLSLITAAFVAYILSLPLFPSQDGPIHLYYTSVLHALLFQHDSFYSQFFTIKHVLPPYSLYYYLLMALSQTGSILLADKIVICLYIVSFSFGLRYLALSIGPSGDVAALLAAPLLLNWPLVMGFVNFCLSTSFAFWALGLWCRSAVKPSHAKRIGFLALCYLIMLTHPVPLIFMLGFCMLEVGVRIVRLRFVDKAGRGFADRARSKANLITDAIYLFFSFGTLIYVKVFTVSNALAQQDSAQITFFHELADSIKNYFLLRTLLAFGGHSLNDIILRFFVLILLGGSLTLAFLQIRRQVYSSHSVLSSWTLADTWTVLAIVLFFGFPLIPGELNNSHFFAYRLVIYVWIAALVAVSRYPGGGPYLRPIMAAIALIMSLQTLLMAHSRLTPIALRIAKIENMSYTPFHQVGLMLHSPNHERPPNVSYEPYYWAGAHLFRQTDSVLYDSPWLDLAIIAIGPQPIMPTYKIDSRTLETSSDLRRLMQSSPAVRNQLLDNVNFVFINNGPGPAPVNFDPLLAADSDARNPWRCITSGWYSICKRAQLPK